MPPTRRASRNRFAESKLRREKGADSRTILSVRDLRVQRSGTVILDNITWSVSRGEHWVILGPNGSGKTSLLSALSGYLTPSGGRISVLGRDYGRADWRELRKEIGLVSSSVRQLMANDEPALESVISGKYAMIDFWGKPLASDRRQAMGILREIECSHLAARPWLVLSQGERQRVLIGRALMARPRLLILDEPCAGLDPAAREQFLHFVQRLVESRRTPTLVLVTHHVEEIMPGFSHVLILKSGKTLASGKISTTLTSRLLSSAFNTAIQLRKTADRYAIRVAVKPRIVV